MDAFSTLVTVFTVTKKIAFLGLPSNQSEKNRNCWTRFKYSFCYDERPLKTADHSQQVVSEIKCCNQMNT